jgi:hypothetical protein
MPQRFKTMKFSTDRSKIAICPMVLLCLLLAFQALGQERPGRGTGSSTSSVTNIIDTSLPVFNTLYTNSSSSNLVVYVSTTNSPDASGYITVQAWVNGGSGFAVAAESGWTPMGNLGVSKSELTFPVNPGGIYYLTNYTSGAAGGGATVITSRRVYSPATQVAVPSVATIDASQITSGTVADARLSTNVVVSSHVNVTNGVRYDYSINTNELYVYAAGTTTVNQKFVWNAAQSCYTNSVNDIIAKGVGSGLRLTNSSGYYYLLSGIGTRYAVWINNWATNTGFVGIYPPPYSIWGTNITGTTNINSVVKNSATNFILNENAVFVSSANGNDSTGRRGDRSFPFLTINAAVTNMVDGDVMELDSGNYSAFNALFPRNSGIFGAGSTLTTIFGSSTNGSAMSAILLFTNVFQGSTILKGLTLVNTNQTTANNYQQLFLANGVVFFDDLTEYGDSDGLYYGIGGQVFYVGKNSDIWASWDTLVTGIGDYFIGNNVNFRSSAGLNGSLWTQRAHGPQGGNITMYGGGIFVTNGTSETWCVGAGTTGAPSYFYDVKCNYYSTNNNASLFQTGGDPTAIHFVSGVDMSASAGGAAQIVPTNTPIANVTNVLACLGTNGPWLFMAK